jgi:mycothiol synthase
VPLPRLVTSPSLSAQQAADVAALKHETARADGVSALSEQTMLLARPGSAPAFHVMAYAGGRLVGYAQLAGGERWGGGDPSGELVVSPGHRRQGVGTQLWGALVSEDGAVRVWAHGSLPAAQALAASLGLVAVRELHKMARPLTPADLATAELPAGFRARAFERGRDEDAWLSANAEAFARHPEQGRLARADLEARMEQPWFDPSGFILLEHEEQPGTVAAFHWTKIAPAPTPTGAAAEGDDEAAPAEGEVYALGVRPAYQGLGLARPLTRLGLAHLAAKGVHEAVLYVDGDNAAALATYRREGFRSIMVDVMYARGSHHLLSG